MPSTPSSRSMKPPAATFTRPTFRHSQHLAVRRDRVGPAHRGNHRRQRQGDVPSGKHRGPQQPERTGHQDSWILFQTNDSPDPRIIPQRPPHPGSLFSYPLENLSSGEDDSGKNQDWNTRSRSSPTGVAAITGRREPGMERRTAPERREKARRIHTPGKRSRTSGRPIAHNLPPKRSVRGPRSLRFGKNVRPREVSDR